MDESATLTATAFLASRLFQSREYPNLHHVRWSYETLRRSDFHWRIERRRFELIKYRFSEREREFIARLRESMRGINDPTPKANLLQRRLESSLFAVEQSLRRFNATQGESVASGLDLPEDVELTKQTALDVDNHLSPLINGSNRELLELYENIEQDSKWAACEKLIRSIMKHGSLRQIVIFTEFSDTAYYLRSLCLNMEWPASVITAGTGEEQLSQYIREAGEKFKILIISSVLRLQGFEIDANQVIHYDLPRDVRLLHLRLTRFLYRNLGELYEWHYFLVNEETKAETTFELDEIRKIELSWIE